MFLTLGRTRWGYAHLLVAVEYKYSKQRLILYNIPIAFHTSLTLKLNIFLYTSPEVFAIAQKYMLFFNGYNEWQGRLYSYILVWFDSMFIALVRNKKKSKSNTGFVSNSVISLCVWRCLQKELSIHLHIQIKGSKVNPFLLGSASFNIPLQPFETKHKLASSVLQWVIFIGGEQVLNELNMIIWHSRAH